MRLDTRLIRIPSMIFLLAIGCGDSAADEGDDEAGTSTTADESGDASDNPEAGSEGNTTTADEGETGSSESSSESGPDDVTTDESDTADTTDATATDTGTTDTETGEPPPNCPMLDEQTCNATDTCTPYMGSPYEVTGDGTICLGEPEFIGCLFAEDACLPATGTLCMGDQAYDVTSLCPPPDGFETCDPPVDPVLPCMP